MACWGQNSWANSKDLDARLPVNAVKRQADARNHLGQPWRHKLAANPPDGLAVSLRKSAMILKSGIRRQVSQFVFALAPDRASGSGTASSRMANFADSGRG